MRRVACVCRKLWSPPSRRRGLKFPCKVEDLPDEKVASFSEAWIEIQKIGAWLSHKRVASFLEARIEIGCLFLLRRNWSKSPHSWRRGLKYF